MRFPILHKQSPALEAQPEAVAQAGSIPLGINREKGEGGFYGKIVYQDVNRPWRYAFIENVRSFDNSAGANPGNASGVPANVTANGDTVFLDCDPSKNGPPGERSIWNDNTPGPFVQFIDTQGQIKAIPGREVLNWAEEVNHNEAVPIGSIVWIRGGETYVEGDHKAIRTDYTFSLNTPDVCTFSINWASGNWTFANDYQGNPTLAMDGNWTINTGAPYFSRWLDCNVSGEYLVILELAAWATTGSMGATSPIGFTTTWSITPSYFTYSFGLISGAFGNPGLTLLPAVGAWSRVSHFDLGQQWNFTLYTITGGTFDHLNGYVTLVKLKGVQYTKP